MRIACSILLLVLLTGCTTDLTGYETYAETLATAAAQGCWSSSAPTPLPITVTPLGGATPTATATAATAGPTLTPLPTTTPLPRCTPGPGVTQEPYPTPRPTEPPYPTRTALLRDPVSQATELLRLPNAVLALDVATHPIINAPVVAAIDIPVLNKDTARVFVRAYDSRTGVWTTGQNVDLPGTHPGSRFRSVATAITPDGTIHVVWGATDYPALEIYAAASRDVGRTWSQPTRLAGGMVGVLDVATSATSNDVFVLAMQRDPAVAPVSFVYDAGQWSERTVLPLDRAWYGSGGSLVISGDGPDATLVALVTANPDVPRTVYMLRRPLSGGAWELVGSRTIPDDTAGSITRAVRGVAYTLQNASGQAIAGVTFTFTLADYPSAYAVTSLDGGQSWGAAEPIVHYGVPAQGSAGPLVLAVAPAFDAAAQRVVTVWSCCADATWGNVEASHSASWSTPSSGLWTPDQGPGQQAQRVALISGAAGAGLTGLAQARNSRIGWLAWVEDGNQVWARTLSLNTIIPVERYPAPTVVPTAGGTAP
jgi:hypothetical protein